MRSVELERENSRAVEVQRLVRCEGFARERAVPAAHESDEGNREAPDARGPRAGGRSPPDARSPRTEDVKAALDAVVGALGRLGRRRRQRRLLAPDHGDGRPHGEGVGSDRRDQPLGVCSCVWRARCRRCSRAALSAPRLMDSVHRRHRGRAGRGQRAGADWDSRGVAPTVVRLYSDAASFVTGHAIVVDGGQAVSGRPRPPARRCTKAPGCDGIRASTRLTPRRR
jgi:hypothetical protein